MGCNTAGQFCISSTFSYVFIHGKWTKFEAGVQTHVCGIVRYHKIIYVQKCGNQPRFILQ